MALPRLKINKVKLKLDHLLIYILIVKLAIWHAQKLGLSLVNLIVIILRAVCMILLIKCRRGIFFPAARAGWCACENLTMMVQASA